MESSAPLRIGMVAGEASGDLLAGLLLDGLKARWPQVESMGIGGPQMQRRGFQAWWPHDRLSVFGYVDALGRLPELLRVRRELAARLIELRPDVFVGVDAPDFNFGLETRLRSAGLKTVHFVCPSIWAWRRERVHKLAKAVDHVLCLFPFEPDLLAAHGIEATYVGHPLADAIPFHVPQAPAREALGLQPDDAVVALLPGSRRSEVSHIAARMAAAAELMRHERPGLRFVLPAAPGLRARIESIFATTAPGLVVQIIEGRSHEALAACDVTLIASGTATLEAALIKRPMVITYHMSWLNWQRMKRMGYQPWVGLPNILSREFVVPELIQEAATPQAMARETLAWLSDGARVRRLQLRFQTLHHQLRQETAQRASDALAQVVRR